MAAFASSADLETHLQFVFDAADHVRADQLLDLASGEIRDYTRLTIDAATGTVEVLDGDGRRRLLLAEVPVTAVDQVRELDSDDAWETLTADDDYRWSANGILIRVGGCWPSKPRSVEVTYDHGHSTVPKTVKQVALEYAARMFTNPEGHMQRRRGDASTSFASSASEALGLTASQQRRLDRVLALRR